MTNQMSMLLRAVFAGNEKGAVYEARSPCTTPILKNFDQNRTIFATEIPLHQMQEEVPQRLLTAQFLPKIEVTRSSALELCTFVTEFGN
jgi:hypothetical protein